MNKRLVLYNQNKKDFELYLSKMRVSKSRDLTHLTRKISPFLKTSILGNYLTLRFKHTSNTVLLMPEEINSDTLMCFKVKSSKHQSIGVEFTIFAASFSDLLRKLTYRFNLFFNEDN